MDTRYFKKILELLLLKLSEDEIYRLIKCLFNEISQENSIKLLKVSASKALLSALEFLELKGMIDNYDCDYLVEALEKIQRPDIAIDLLFTEPGITASTTSNQNGMHNIKINGLDIELKFRPYNFQIKLAQLGCDGKNNIVCLRTGAGKTLIAAIICKFWKLKKAKLRAAFLVPTRHLAQQQCDAFENVFNRNDLQEIGESMNEQTIYQFSKVKNVIFLTPQKLVNTLEKTSLKIFDFDLVIFDEAHHTADNHPYNKIMLMYYEEKLQTQVNKTLILGLTASLGTGKKRNALSNLLKLSANLDCKEIACLSDGKDIEELNRSIPTPFDDKIHSVERCVLLNPLFDKVVFCIGSIASRGRILLGSYMPTRLNKGRIGEPEFESFLKQYEVEAIANECRDQIIALKYISELNIFYKRLEDFHINFCIQIMDDFYLKTMVKEPIEIETYARDEIKGIVSYMKENKHVFDCNKKLETLVNLIKTCHRADSRGLVLVRTRQHTKALNEYFKEMNLLVDKVLISPCVLTGQGSAEDLLMNDSEQRNVIDNFRQGIYNLMVATDIAQEGLDVPKCQYVIRYEFVSNEIGTVQSRGRARAMNGHCFLITSAGSLNEKRELENREKEIEMNQALKEMNSTDSDKLNEIYEAYHVQKVSECQQARSSKTSFSVIRRPIYEAEDFTIHCRNCSNKLFSGSDLVHRDPSYYCTDKRFIKELIQVDSRTEKFFCLDKSCCNELGRLVKFRNRSPMFMIEIKSIKFLRPDGRFELISKWSKVLDYFSIRKHTGY